MLLSKKYLKMQTNYEQKLESLLSRAKQALSPKAYELYKSLVRPSARMVPGGKETTFIGGTPNLPNKSFWPYAGNIPYIFMGQIDLADIPKEFPSKERDGLPETGILSFFYTSTYDVYEYEDEWDEEHDFLGKVLYFDKATKLENIDFPEIIQDEHRHLKSSRQFITVPTVPDEFTLEEDFPGILEEGEQEIWWEFSETIQEEYSSYGPGYGPHLFLGNATSMQLPVRDETECLFETPTSRRDIRLLAQFTSDEEIGSMWGDAGAVYFAITEDDLKNFSLDNVVAFYSGG